MQEVRLERDLASSNYLIEGRVGQAWFRETGAQGSRTLQCYNGNSGVLTTLEYRQGQAVKASCQSMLPASQGLLAPNNGNASKPEKIW